MSPTFFFHFTRTFHSSQLVRMLTKTTMGETYAAWRLFPYFSTECVGGVAIAANISRLAALSKSALSGDRLSSGRDS